MKETENHLLGHLSICDSWLKLRRHVGVSFAFSGQNWSECTVIFTHLHHDWNLQKMISKELSLSVKSNAKKLGNTTCTTTLKVWGNLYDLPFFTVSSYLRRSLSVCSFPERLVMAPVSIKFLNMSRANRYAH